MLYNVLKVLWATVCETRKQTLVVIRNNMSNTHAVITKGKHRFNRIIMPQGLYSRLYEYVPNALRRSVKLEFRCDIPI